MAATDLARNLCRPCYLERLAVDDGDLLSVSDVQELLARVRGQGQVPRELCVGLDQLSHELSIGREQLDAPVLPVGHIDHPVPGHAYGMDDVEALWTRTVRERLRRDDHTRIVINRFVSEGAPHPLEFSAIRVEHDHTVVAVPVG